MRTKAKDRTAFLKISHLFVVTALAVFFMPATGRADEALSMAQMQKQIELLSQQVQKLSAVVEEQGKVIDAQKAQMAAVAPAVNGQKPAPDDGVKITMNPMPKISSADGKYSLQPTARLQTDVTAFHDDKSDMPDNVNIRRARLGFKGNLGEDFNYKIEADFGSEAVNIKEMYLAYTGLKFADIWAGSFKPPLGMEQNTSSNYISFLELSPASNAFTRDETLGAALKGGGDNWSWTAGVFNEDPGTTSTGDEAVSFDGHLSANVLGGTPYVLHLGVGTSIRTPNATTGAVTLSAKPAGTGPVMITTGAIADVDRSYIVGPELAGVFGPLSVQGEYFRDWINRSVGPDAAFGGYYGQIGYFLTGESRPYKGKTGNFDRVRPKNPLSLENGGWGAWEVLGRYDDLDLNDAGAGINGGRMSDWTAGVNWYMTDYIKMMVNFQDVHTDGHAVVPDNNPQVYSLRLQWDF